MTLAPARALSQRARGPETSVVVGPSHYALDTTGTGFAFRLGLAFPLARTPFFLEPALGFLTSRNTFGSRVSWFFPELGFQAQLGHGGWRPFVGAGAGAGVQSRIGSDRWELTVHAATGLRIQVGDSWGLRAEVRLRAVHPFRWQTIDFMAGFVRGMFR